MKKLIVVFLMASNIMCFAQESATLKYNHKKGDKYIMTLSLSQSMGIAGSSSLMMNTKVEVSKVTKDGFTLISKVKKISTESIQGGKKTKFDTNMKEETLDTDGKKLKSQLSPIVMSTSYITFNKQGKILNERIEPNLNGSNKGMAIYCEFPKEALKVASSWTNEQEIQGIKLKIIYTVKRITSNTVETVIAGNVNFMGITGNLNGVAIFDKKNGNTDEMKINTSINMQGMEISMSLETTSKKTN
ncbi:MAG: hypothetical protein JXQ93_05750 [Flavobacteriaceae bacterium]